MSRAVLALLAVIAFLSLLRPVPAVLTGSLFSTDVWPLYRGTNAILGGAKLWDESAFGGHSNHWPGVMLLAAALSSVTGLGAREVFTYVLTPWFALAMATALYAFLRYFFPPRSSAIGVAAAGLIPSVAVFTSSPLKEVMSYPIIFLILGIVWGRGRRGTALLPLLALGAVITHHLSSFMLTGFLAGFVLAGLVYWLKGVAREVLVPSRVLAASVVVGSFLATYFIAFGVGGLRELVALASSDVTSYLLYTITIYFGFILFVGAGRGSALLIISLVALATALPLALGMSALVPGVVIRPTSVIWYVVPVATYLIVLLPGVRDVIVRILVAGFGLFIAVNAAFVTFGEPLLADLLPRFLNYVFMPVSVLAAHWFTRGGFRSIATVGAIAVAAVSCVAVFAGVIGGWDASSHWVYRPGEVAGFDEVVSLSSTDVLLVGDEKVRYFAEGIREISPEPVLKILFLGREPPPNTLVILYKDNLRYGFVVGLSRYGINNVLGPSSFSKVYDDGYVEALYWGGSG